MASRIAYLAPELPGASSTFVYNEIFALEDMGIEIFPFSVHNIELTGEGERLAELTKRRTVIYHGNWLKLLSVNLQAFFRHPLNYLRTLKIAIGDVFSTRNSLKLSVGLMYRFLHGVALACRLTDLRIQHLHAHFAHVPVDISMYAAAFSKIPFSFTAHANDIFQRGYLLPEKAKRAKFVTTISSFNVQFLIDKGVPTEKLHLVRCGIDSSQFETRKHKEKSGLTVFGFIGRLVEKKGIDVLLEACVNLKNQNHQFLVDVVGDGPLLSQTKNSISKLNLHKEVSMKGSLPHKEVSKWLDTIDYLVLPCKKDRFGDMDGIPVVLMEAMLKGVSVITTDISGIPELVIHGETGFSVECNKEAISNAMREAIDEPESRRETRIQKGSELVKREFELFRNSRKLNSLFAEI
ncbi:glycosyltransferase [Microbulbifer sp. SA54]|uniref:glycosyltransferase n=1 Tax=Microbulbifer sp. SA54 TaxID=3401577 RepID=UPI003AB0A1D5